MAARGLIEGRDAHEAMDAGLGREQPVGVLAADKDRRALQAGFLARLVVHEFALEAAPLGPPHVHPQEHLRPVLRFGAASPWMDRENGVAAIVLAAEHFL